MTRREIITRYARDCLEGKIPACRKHKNFCKRLLRDFEKFDNDPEFPYYWDESEAEKIVQWFALLRHSKGELAGQPIVLNEWQQANVCQLYGWKRKENNRRRFKKLFIEVSRKNAKSQMLSGIALYECACTSSKNGEVAEIYTAGSKREQSLIVFEEADLMLRGSSLRRKFNITKSMIKHIKTGSYIKALSKDDRKSGDGSNPALLILDEFHQHPTTEFYDLSIGSNTKEPLLTIITTAGKDLSFPCYREYQFCSQILDPDVDVEDDEYLIDILEQDKEEVENPKILMNEALWLKSNPIRATYKAGIENIKTTYQKALKVPEDLPSCLTKNFDIWVQAKENGYMDMTKFKLCEVDTYPVAINGLSCTVGVDMAAKIDLASICFVIPFQDLTDLDIEGEPITKYILIPHSFIPNRQKLLEREMKDKVSYQAWEQQGFITVTDTEIVDQKTVLNWTMEKAKELGLVIENWAFDPWNSAMAMTYLQDLGETVFEVYQSYSGLNDATVGLREEIYQQHIFYKKDPVLNFAMSNAVTRKSDGKIKIDKDATKFKIDPVDAAINGFKFAVLIEQDAKNRKLADDALDSWLEASEDWF